MKAFPRNIDNKGYQDDYSGMDLRDYFAAKYITNNGIPLAKEYFAENAKNAYEWADAMMEARNDS
jgi:hypothetical protein